MSLDEKIAFLVNLLFGAAIGFALYFLPLGGFWHLLTNRNSHWWNGWLAFLVCVGGGALSGALSYKNRLKNLDIESGDNGIYSGSGGLDLLWRRIVVLIVCAVAAYYIWQLAKGI